jgi:D-glycero-D-manno-heptose 1,7-bisphosphate phosphatase
VGVADLSGGNPVAGRRAVFLDRDGVINRTFWNGAGTEPPASLAQLDILPGVKEALEALRRAGFRLVVVTNQPDVARGKTSRETVEAINESLRSQLPLDSFEVCFHDDADGCDCRKPAPGLLLRAAARDGIDLTRSYLVGDRWRDIEAGQRAACTTILVDHDHSEPRSAAPWRKVSSLLEAAEVILQSVSQVATVEA